MSSQAVQYVALVTGATGLTGRHMVIHLDESNKWKVYAVSRRGLQMYTGKELKNTQAVQVDLADASNCARDLAKYPDITHIFHCAYTTGGDEYQDAEKNRTLLQHAVEAVEKAGGNKLQHVYLQSGTKWYGQSYLTKFKTPFEEDDPRYLPPNFYYSQEDYLRERVAGGATWSFSSLRPNPVIGFSDKSYMNLLNCIAVYGTLCAAMGLPFRFPGSEAAYDAAMEHCDVDVLADAAIYTSTHEQTKNQSYNVSNGDVFRWRYLWPKLADRFGLPVATPQKVSLATVMNTPDKKQVWARLQQRHGLADIPYEDLAPWAFADFVFSLEWDAFASVQKLRRAGYQGMNLGTAEGWLQKIDQLRVMKIIPATLNDAVVHKV